MTDTKIAAKQVIAQQQKLRLRTNYINALELRAQAQFQASTTAQLAQKFRQI